jgi:hypothetical protein
MNIVPVENIGQAGLIKDTESILLPPNAFSDVLNVRLRNGSVGTMPGETLFKTVALGPDYGLHWTRPDIRGTLFIKDGTAILLDAEGNLTFNPGSGSYPDSRWQIDKFGGGYAIYINNGKSTPLYLLAGDPAADTTFVEFPGWNYQGVTVTAKVIRPFNYSLVAANFTLTEGDNVVNAPVTLRISVQAPVGAFPLVWEPGTTNDTADEFEIKSDTPIVDMKELRGNLYIYTANSIHVLSQNNGFAIVRPYSNAYGALSLDCIAEFTGNHFVVDRNDIYVHNGSGEIKSVADKVIRDYFLSSLNQTYAENTFVVRNTRFKEIWVCFPNQSSTGLCNEALIYSYAEGHWSKRQLPNVKSIFISEGIRNGDFVPGEEILVGCTGTPNTFQFDSGWNMWNGTSFASYESYVIRERLMPKDPSGDSQINALYPVLQGINPNTTISAKLLTSDVYDAVVNWGVNDPRTVFTVDPKELAYGYKLDPRTQGRFISYKFSSNQPWKLSTLHLGIVPNKNRR